MDVDKEHYPLLRELGMKVAMTRSHHFTVGPFCRDNHPLCIKQLRAGIDLAVLWDCPHVIAFTGNRTRGTSDDRVPAIAWSAGNRWPGTPNGKA